MNEAKQSKERKKERRVLIRSASIKMIEWVSNSEADKIDRLIDRLTDR